MEITKSERYIISQDIQSQLYMCLQVNGRVPTQSVIDEAFDFFIKNSDYLVNGFYSIDDILNACHHATEKL